MVMMSDWQSRGHFYKRHRIRPLVSRFRPRLSAMLEWRRIGYYAFSPGLRREPQRWWIKRRWKELQEANPELRREAEAVPTEPRRCPSCSGNGYRLEWVCKDCNGTGREVNHG